MFSSPLSNGLKLLQGSKWRRVQYEVKKSAFDVLSGHKAKQGEAPAAKVMTSASPVLEVHYFYFSV